MAGAYTTAIFIIVPIENVVAAVLDGPVLAVNLENTLRVGLIGGFTGDTVGDFKRTGATLLVSSVSLDDESLSDVREVEVVVEFGGGPDLSGFDASVIRGRMLNEMRFPPIPEVLTPDLGELRAGFL